MEWRSGSGTCGFLQQFCGALAMLVLASCIAAPNTGPQPSATPAQEVQPSSAPAPTAMPTAAPTPWPQAQANTALPADTPTLMLSPSPFAGTPAPVLTGMLISSTTRLDVYRIEGGLPITALLDLTPQFEQAIDRVGERMGAHLSGRIALSF